MPDRALISTAGLKVLAFLMAVALWGFVSLSSRTTSMPDLARRRLSVPLEVKHAPPFTRVHFLPSFVEVTVEGPAKATDKVSESDISAFVDLHFRAADRRMAKVSVSVPEGMRFQVNPQQVTLITLQAR